MLKKYLTRAFVALSAALTLVACEGQKTDPREAFVGEYSFVTTGDIDLYAAGVKVATVPLDQQGDMSISLGDKENAVFVKIDKDSTTAYVSGNQLFMEPTHEDVTINELVMSIKFIYGKGELVEDRLTMSADVDVTATYREAISLSGSAKVDIVATKK